MIHSFPPRSALHLEGPSMCTSSKACLGSHGAGHFSLLTGSTRLCISVKNPQTECLKVELAKCNALLQAQTLEQAPNYVPAWEETCPSLNNC